MKCLNWRKIFLISFDFVEIYLCSLKNWDIYWEMWILFKKYKSYRKIRMMHYNTNFCIKIKERGTSFQYNRLLITGNFNTGSNLDRNLFLWKYRPKTFWEEYFKCWYILEYINWQIFSKHFKKIFKMLF